MILAYHEITPRDSRYRYSVTRELLDTHLELVAQFRNQQREARAIPEVTFDDGDRSNYALGLELLQKHSVLATFFVVTGRVGSDGFMTWPELKELVSLGHRVQSHGWSHRPLTARSEAELREELGRSKNTIEDRLGVPVQAVSAPYGRWDDRLLKACAAADYREVYLSNPWKPTRQREGVSLIGRYMVQRSLSVRQLQRLLAGDPTYLLLLSSRYRAKEALRSLIGHATYQKLWMKLAKGGDVTTPKMMD